MTTSRSRPGDPDTQVATLANGVRVVVVRLPHLATAAASVFVRSGSQHESAECSGIGHVIEHMAFKGTRYSTPGPPTAPLMASPRRC